VIADRDRIIDEFRSAQSNQSATSSSSANTMQTSLAQLVSEK
jgi:hypothetical protein